jgi:spore maturation protein CgeB
MRILYAAHKFDYGETARGFSFEHFNLFDSLLSLGHEILYFDLGPLRKPDLRDKLNQKLLEIAKSHKPDVMFTVLFEEELDRKIVEQISRLPNIATINWFCDDHWRFENFSRLWAPCFNWVVTTAQSAVPKYERIGYRNAIKSQWACNTHLYRKLDVPLAHDISFIGQPHGNRRAVIEAIRAAGLDVKTWGNGWETGRLDQDELVLRRRDRGRCAGDRCFWLGES